MHIKLLSENLRGVKYLGDLGVCGNVIVKIKIYKTVILSVVLRGCETWSITFREEHSLRDFENRVLRRIFGPQREEDVSWRKLHNDELHSLYSSPYIVRVIKSRTMN
jgi:hypothetical protein